MALKKLTTQLEVSRTGGSIAVSDALNILYVEDNDTNWVVAELALRDSFNLRRAADSDEALELVQKEKFDLILMDIELQGSRLDGIELTKILKSPSASSVAGLDSPLLTPVFFMTAYSGRYTRDELLVLGGDELVSKPVDFEQLESLITRFFRSP